MPRCRALDAVELARWGRESTNLASPVQPPSLFTISRPRSDDFLFSTRKAYIIDLMIYVVLLRGINVGGKNKIPMSELRLFLEGQGFTNVITYIQSGNVIVQSDLDAKTLGKKIEENLPKRFTLDSSIVKVLVLTRDQLQAIIDNKPKGFGEQPEKYYSDAIFLMDIALADAMSVFSPKEGVDSVWPGDGVIYSQRLGTMRTKSRLNRIIGTVPYQSMTIRNWATTTKLLDMVNAIDA